MIGYLWAHLGKEIKIGKGIEELIVILEHILESDPRTIKEPECEYDWLFDRVHEALKKAKELERNFT